MAVRLERSSKRETRRSCKPFEISTSNARPHPFFHRSGRIAQLSSKAKAQGSTTLQKEIYRFVIIIASIALTLAIIVIIAWAAWLNKKHKGFISVAALVINVVSVMVAMIPGELTYVCVSLLHGKDSCRILDSRGVAGQHYHVISYRSELISEEEGSLQEFDDGRNPRSL